MANESSDKIGSLSVDVIADLSQLDQQLGQIEDRLRNLANNTVVIQIAADETQAPGAARTRRAASNIARTQSTGVQTDLKIDDSSLATSIRSAALEAFREAIPVKLQIDIADLQSQLSQLHLPIGAPGSAPVVGAATSFGAQGSPSTVKPIPAALNNALQAKGVEDIITSLHDIVSEQLQAVGRGGLPGRSSVVEAFKDLTEHLGDNLTDWAKAEGDKVTGSLSSLFHGSPELVSMLRPNVNALHKVFAAYQQAGGRSVFGGGPDLANLTAAAEAKVKEYERRLAVVTGGGRLDPSEAYDSDKHSTAEAELAAYRRAAATPATPKPGGLLARLQATEVGNGSFAIKEGMEAEAQAANLAIEQARGGWQEPKPKERKLETPAMQRMRGYRIPAGKGKGTIYRPGILEDILGAYSGGPGGGSVAGLSEEALAQIAANPIQFSTAGMAHQLARQHGPAVEVEGRALSAASRRLFAGAGTLEQRLKDYSQAEEAYQRALGKVGRKYEPLAVPIMRGQRRGRSMNEGPAPLAAIAGQEHIQLGGRTRDWIGQLGEGGISLGAIQRAAQAPSIKGGGGQLEQWVEQMEGRERTGRYFRLSQDLEGRLPLLPGQRGPLPGLTGEYQALSDIEMARRLMLELGIPEEQVKAATSRGGKLLPFLREGRKAGVGGSRGRKGHKTPVLGAMMSSGGGVFGPDYQPSAINAAMGMTDALLQRAALAEARDNAAAIEAANLAAPPVSPTVGLAGLGSKIPLSIHNQIQAAKKAWQETQGAHPGLGALLDEMLGVAEQHRAGTLPSQPADFGADWDDAAKRWVPRRGRNGQAPSGQVPETEGGQLGLAFGAMPNDRDVAALQTGPQYTTATAAYQALEEIMGRQGGVLDELGIKGKARLNPEKILSRDPATQLIADIFVGLRQAMAEERRVALEETTRKKPDSTVTSYTERDISMAPVFSRQTELDLVEKRIAELAGRGGTVAHDPFARGMPVGGWEQLGVMGEKGPQGEHPSRLQPITGELEIIQRQAELAAAKALNLWSPAEGAGGKPTPLRTQGGKLDPRIVEHVAAAMAVNPRVQEINAELGSKEDPAPGTLRARFQELMAAKAAEVPAWKTRLKAPSESRSNLITGDEMAAAAEAKTGFIRPGGIPAPPPLRTVGGKLFQKAQDGPTWQPVETITGRTLPPPPPPPSAQAAIDRAMGGGGRGGRGGGGGNDQPFGGETRVIVVGQFPLPVSVRNVEAFKHLWRGGGGGGGGGGGSRLSEEEIAKREADKTAAKETKERARAEREAAKAARDAERNAERAAIAQARGVRPTQGALLRSLAIAGATREELESLVTPPEFGIRNTNQALEQNSVLEARQSARDATNKLTSRALSTTMIQLAQRFFGGREDAEVRILALQREASDLDKLARDRAALQERKAESANRLGTLSGLAGSLVGRGQAVPGELSREIELETEAHQGLTDAVDESEKAVKKQTDAVAKAAKEAVTTKDVLRNLAAGFAGGVAGAFVTKGVGLAAQALPMVAELMEPGIAMITEHRKQSALLLSALADQVIAHRGATKEATTLAAAEAGLSAATYKTIGPALEQAAAIEAGNKMFGQRIGLVRAGELAAQGTPRGLIQPTGGFNLLGLETPFFATPSTLENFNSMFAGMMDARGNFSPENIGNALGQGSFIGRIFGGEPLGAFMSGGPQGFKDWFAEATGLDKMPARIDMFNADLAKAGSQFRLAAGKADQGTGVLVEYLASVGADRGTIQRLIDLQLSATDRQGRPISTLEQAQQFFMDWNRGQQTPDPELLLASMTQRQLPAQLFQMQAVAALGRQAGLAQTALGQIASPRLPLGAGLAGAPGAFGAGFGNRPGLPIIDAALNFRTQQGKGEIENLLSVLAPEDQAQARTSLEILGALGRTLQGLEVERRQIQFDQIFRGFNQELKVATRSMGDILGLAGKTSMIMNDGTEVQTTMVGALERENMLIGRNLQLLGFQRAERQLNYRIALAGFMGEGATGEERAARRRLAMEDAEFERKSLVGQRKIADNNWIIQQENIARNLEDQTFAWNEIVKRMEELGRTTALDEQISRVQELSTQISGTVGSYLEQGVQFQNTMITITSQMIESGADSLTAVRDQVVSAMNTAAENLRTIRDQTLGGVPIRDIGPGIPLGNTTTVNINNPTVRSENDLRTIVSEVEKVLNSKTAIYRGFTAQ